MALRIKEDKQIQEAYFTAAYLAGDEEAFWKQEEGFLLMKINVR